MRTSESCLGEETLRRSLDPDDPMSDDERARIARHIEDCDNGCKDIVAALVRGSGILGMPPLRGWGSSDRASSLDNSLPTLAGYEILRDGELGRGGMGVVYKARQLALGGRPVAIKIFRPPVQEKEREDQAHFAREVHALCKLNHVNIVRVYDGGLQAGRRYLVMELVEGGSLKAYLGGMPQAPRKAAEIVATLAEAIEVAHGHGIIHRDLKPENILLTTDGIPKISDFGLAKRLDEETNDDVHSCNKFLGTVSYASPEQANGLPVGRSDGRLRTRGHPVRDAHLESPIQGLVVRRYARSGPQAGPGPPVNDPVEDPAQLGNNLSEVSAERADQALPQRRGAGRRPRTLP